jgi:transposase-like protein
MEVGREFERLVERGVKALERNAEASEQLIALANDERTDSVEDLSSPPKCPHCGTFNPTIRNEGAQGSMEDFTLVATCSSCGKTFFGFPTGWFIVKTPEEARTVVRERAGNGRA